MSGGRLATFARWSGLAIVGVASLISYHAVGRGLPADVVIIELRCGLSPEYVVIRNVGSTAEPLDGFRLVSEPEGAPGQDVDLSSIVSSIPAGAVVTFQSGPDAAPDPAAGLYRLSPNEIYRNGDPTDFSRLVRPDGSTMQVNCGSNLGTPPPAETQTVTATPSAEPTGVPTSTPTTPASATATPTATLQASIIAPAPPSTGTGPDTHDRTPLPLVPAIGGAAVALGAFLLLVSRRTAER